MLVSLTIRQLGLARAGIKRRTAAKASSASEDDKVDQRIRTEAVCAVDRHARGFTHSHKALNNRIGIATLLGEHFAMIVRRDAAHIVVDCRQDRDRLLGDIHAGKHFRGL